MTNTTADDVLACIAYGAEMSRESYVDGSHGGRTMKARRSDLCLSALSRMPARRRRTTFVPERRPLSAG